MLFLIHNVFDNRVALALGIRKCSEPILPLKLAFIKCLSFIHLLLFAFTAPIKSETLVVTGIPDKICTWSFHPPTASDFASLPVIIPEIYWCKVPRQSLVIKLSRCFTAKHGMDGDLRICIWHRNVAPMGLVLFRFLLLPKYRPDGADLMVSYHSIKMPRWDWFVVSFLLLPKCRPAVL